MRGLLLIGCALLLLAPTPGSARDTGADGRFETRRSTHFVLYQDVDIDRYSGPSGSRRFEKDVLAILEDAYDDVANVLRIHPRSELDVMVYDAELFDLHYAPRFRFRAAGFFDGRLHVRGGTRVDHSLVRTLHHEYVHAALASQAPQGSFPAWLNEGVAEWFERAAVGQRRRTPWEDGLLRQLVVDNRWLPLSQLSGPTFSGLSGETAGVAYLEAYATVDYIVRSQGHDTLRKLVESTARTRRIERSLRKTLGQSLDELDEAVRKELS